MALTLEALTTPTIHFADPPAEFQWLRYVRETDVLGFGYGHGTRSTDFIGLPGWGDLLFADDGTIRTVWLYGFEADILPRYPELAQAWEILRRRAVRDRTEISPELAVFSAWVASLLRHDLSGVQPDPA